MKTFHAERMRVLAAGFIFALGLATSFSAHAGVPPPRPTEFDLSQGSYARAIARARTFGFTVMATLPLHG